MQQPPLVTRLCVGIDTPKLNNTHAFLFYVSVMGEDWVNASVGIEIIECLHYFQYIIPPISIAEILFCTIPDDVV